MSNMRNRSQRSGSNGGSHGGSSHSGSSYGSSSHSGSRPKTVSKSNSSRRSNGSANVAGAKSNYDKYIERANEAKSYGDRVSAEKFLQYADHYMRIIIESEEKRESSGNKEEFDINANYTEVNPQQNTDKESEFIDCALSVNGNIPKEFCL